MGGSMKLTGKNIAIATLIIGILALASSWIIPKVFSPSVSADVSGEKNQVMKDVKTGNGGQIAQAGAGSTINQTVNNFYGVKPVDPAKTKQLEKQAKEQNVTPYLDRPKVVIASPSATFVNYTDNIQTGLVKVGFNIPFINIGGADAKDITTKWLITDNGNTITGLDKWLMQYLNQPNLVIQDLPPNKASSIYYNPDIGASGTGTLELTLDYEYTNAATGEKYNDRYKGMVYYKTEKNNQPVMLLLTPKL